MLDKTSSIICAFGLAAAAPRSPYRHLELCGIALTFYVSVQRTPCRMAAARQTGAAKTQVSSAPGQGPVSAVPGRADSAPAGWGSQLPAAAVLHGDLTQGAHLLHAGGLHHLQKRCDAGLRRNLHFPQRASLPALNKSLMPCQSGAVIALLSAPAFPISGTICPACVWYPTVEPHGSESKNFQQWAGPPSTTGGPGSRQTKCLARSGGRFWCRRASQAR